MMKYVPPAAIECNKASLVARKIIFHPPRRNTSYPQLKVIFLYPCKLDLNSKAIIVAECNPKIYIVDEDSMLNVNDGIGGDMIYCLIAAPIKKPEVKPASSSHKASYIDTKAFTYAKLEKPFKSIESKQERKLLSTQGYR